MAEHPKPERTKLTSKEYHQMREQIYKDQLHACAECSRWIPLIGMHVHHIKSKGAGGGDDKTNLVGLCWECHRKVHDGNIRYRGMK